ncbi:competence protein ComK [Jeotgalibacillus aurantiacus]|uniref:competence protein ComK n=1 Tax=Jeotgalibacillus aurantiacus TaxID=2763266 RepID=UPI001D0A2551|nr:competence protein ComK [Jeotgalibacillus aurantiacus]
MEYPGAKGDGFMTGSSTLEPYRVTETTLALQYDFSIEHETVAYDQNGVFRSPKSAKDLLNDRCLQAGVLLEGRIASAKVRHGIQHKVPLLVDPYTDILAFPTHSPTSPHNTWLFLKHIVDLMKTDDPKQVKVLFRNYETLTINCSPRTAIKQYERAAKLFYMDVYQQRK